MSHPSTWIDTSSPMFKQHSTLHNLRRRPGLFRKPLKQKVMDVSSSYKAAGAASCRMEARRNSRHGASHCNDGPYVLLPSGRTL